MLATIIGLGSIGMRRAEILQNLGVEIEGIDPYKSPDGIKMVDRPSGDVIFICTPPNVRRRPIEMAWGRRMFIEKPLAAPRTLPRALLWKLRENPPYVSENLLWDYTTREFFSYLKDSTTKKNMESIRHLSLRFSYDLSRWRKDPNYRKSYNARLKYSLIFDSHEINLLCHYFGKPDRVFSQFSKLRIPPLTAYDFINCKLIWKHRLEVSLISSYSGEYTRYAIASGRDLFEPILEVHFKEESIAESYEIETRAFINSCLPKPDPWPFLAMSVHDALIRSHRKKIWIGH